MGTVVEGTDVEGDRTYLVGIRFKPCGKVYTFDPAGLELKTGDRVVVDSMFGLTIGTVVSERVEDAHPQKDLKSIIRRATGEDMSNVENNKLLGEEARRYCLERIAIRSLPMKLVGTEVTLDRKRIVFYFTADGRIDFRELVKDLAAKFRTRIEMRQIGVRDEAKLIGGIGVCGRPLCCSTFLTGFAPISIKMAKEQELVLNTSKLSGVCGRLMCCLGYEHDGQITGDAVDEIITEDGISLPEGLPSEIFEEPVAIEDIMPVEPEVPSATEAVEIMEEEQASTGGPSGGEAPVAADTVSGPEKTDAQQEGKSLGVPPAGGHQQEGEKPKRFKTKKGHYRHKGKKRRHR